MSNTDMFLMSFGPADLRIGVSEAKFDAQSDSEVHSAVAPQKPHNRCQNMTFWMTRIVGEKFEHRQIQF